MALDPILWALKDAPVRSPIERVVITVYAEAADDDGCHAYPSYATVAERVPCDRKTVQRTVRELVRRGLMARGDQSAAAHIPARYRPVVYDVLVPYSWWGTRIDRVNRYRAERGRPPLTPASRPDLAPAPERRVRSDAGRPRHEGGLSVPPHGSTQGGLSVPARGDSQSLPGGTESPPTLPYNPPHDPPPTPQPAAALPERGQAGRQAGETPEQGEVSSPPVDGHDQEVTAAALVDGLPWPAGQAPDPDTRDRLIGAAAACLTAGHPQATVTSTAADGIPGARRPAAVVLHRLRRLATQPPDRAAAEREQAEQDRREAARTPHPYSEGPRTGYCDRCGHHETHRVHRSATPATAGSACPATTTVERCAEHSRRVCLPCHHHGRDQDDNSNRKPTPTGSRPRTAPRQRPADDTSAMTTLGALLESWRHPATV